MDSQRQTSHRSLQRPCVHFFRGNCRFGERCKFSHVVDGGGSSQVEIIKQHGRGTRDANIRDDTLRAWQRLLKPPPIPLRRSLEVCKNFFQLAIQLMEGDVGASQVAIRLMAADDGLAFIRDIAEYHIPNANHGDKTAKLWHEQVRLLFNLVTHPRVIDSAVLEQEVATIYNFMQGIGGRRMATIFNFVTGVLDNWSILPEWHNTGSQLAISELCLAVLAKMVDCITSNVVNEHFQPILQRLEPFTVASEGAPDTFSRIQAQKYLEYIKNRLGVGDAMHLSNKPQHTPVLRAEFVMRRDLPGHLSAEGPRHDNDHADIRQISILPTQQEIASPRGEYLPTTDSSLFHILGIRGRLDREFRLLREDTVGQLRDAVRAQLEHIRNPVADGRSPRNNSLRTYVYRNAHVQKMEFEKRNGMDLLIEFQQPIAGSNRQKRRDWWAHSKRLQPGGLVCVISQDSVLFCTVADSMTINAEPNGNNAQRTADGTTADLKEAPSLAGDSKFSYVHLQIAEPVRSSMMQVLHWYRSTDQHQRFLVEFPGVLLPSFQHTLQALQRMSQKPAIPFTKMIAPPTGNVEFTALDPPQYSVRQGFFFDLTCLTSDQTVLRHSHLEAIDPKELTDHSSLDLTQSTALLNSLLRGLSLIQGPPGTGKSYTGEKLIKVLLANKTRAKLGPILCVCYTNHALDQLLEHLYRDGVKQIIRIGSRSKSETLENLNLRLVSRLSDRTKHEKYELWTSEGRMEEQTSEITQGLDELGRSRTNAAIEKYLRGRHPGHHQALFGADAAGFRMVTGRGKDVLNQWLQSGSVTGSTPRAIDDLLHTPLWSMSRSERNSLHKHWLEQRKEELITRILDEHETYARTREHRDRVRQDIDLRCLSDADIVGVTTTGLAKNLNLLQRLRCKVMLCEEAGEVLEAHTLTALLPSVEHAILIGDHLQLRPQIQNYDLQSTNPRGSQYSLDVSLFERLVSPPSSSDIRIPFDTLETQRRMHPSISELVRSTLYPSLEDGGNVLQYPAIFGMKERLFWFHHESPEDRETQLDLTTTSHTNAFELQMTVALVQHLVRQGSYGPGDIAVITPYLGQLQQLRRVMQSMFEISVGERDLEELEALDPGENEEEETQARESVAVKTTLLKSIRLATVDNFQGEEAKVVVISLVRSNRQRQCGFLSTPNRINVLLSRAQHGMYLIADIQKQQYLSPSPITFFNSHPKAVAACVVISAFHVAIRASTDVILTSYIMLFDVWSRAQE